MEEQGQKLSEALKVPSGSTSGFPSFRSSTGAIAASPASWQEDNDGRLETQFLLPSGHSATLVWLLSLPPVQFVLGDFPKSLFCTLEEDAALPPPLDPFQPFPVDWPSLKADRLRVLADAYFDNSSSHLPLITRQYYQELQESLFQNGLRQDLGTAMCLCVWALGSMASHLDTEDMDDSHEDLGLDLFSVALKIIMAKMMLSFTPSLHFCQALVLAALYFDGLGRPLYAWKMTDWAGRQFLQIVNLYVFPIHLNSYSVFPR